MLFTCLPKNDSLEEIKKCQDGTEVKLKLVCISLKPLAFALNNFLSDFESDHIISLGEPNVRRSRAGGRGGFESQSRTSATSWVGTKASVIMPFIYKRAANLLNLPEEILNEAKNAEQLQFVKYNEGEKYNAHHDFGSSGEGRFGSRFITLLLYLNDRPNNSSGGETGFPKARNGEGLLAYPGKGNAVMFYNILEDGNYDGFALHEARPPLGDWTKYLCNFWIWDPHR